MKIKRLDIRNYRGVAHVVEDIPPAGAVVTGGNGEGKTSILRAIRAGLAAQDIGEDAVRIGAEKAEILINIDDVSVRRVITASGSRLAVVNKDGMSPRAPQTFLAELLGTSPLDPLDLLLTKPKERRARILEALPIKLTLEQLRTWAPDATDDVAGHGLEVLARVRKRYYDARTSANRRAADAKGDAERLDAEQLALQSRVPKSVPPLAVAQTALDDARRALSELEGRAHAARAAQVRGESARERVATLERDAEEIRREAGKYRVEDSQIDEAGAAVQAAKVLVGKLERELSAAKTALVDAREAVEAIEKRQAEARRLDSVAANRDKQVADFRAVLGELALEPVSDAELAQLREAVAGAESAISDANTAQAAEQAKARWTAAEESRKAAQADADRLDGIVKALTDDAPAALLASAEAIPGLGLDGDDVTLDGKRLDVLSGAEQLWFCVEVARRLNGKSKILIVDGLERLDVDQREEFVRHATSDDWQLLATLVDRGAPVFAAIEPSDVHAGAQ